MDDFNDLMPDVADIIEVLWNVQEGKRHWWTAQVLNITPKNIRGKIVGTGIIQYYPGRGLNKFSDYQVQFFKDKYIYHVTKGTTRPFRQSSWRFKVTSKATSSKHMSLSYGDLCDTKDCSENNTTVKNTANAESKDSSCSTHTKSISNRHLGPDVSDALYNTCLLYTSDAADD